MVFATLELQSSYGTTIGPYYATVVGTFVLYMYARKILGGASQIAPRVGGCATSRSYNALSMHFSHVLECRDTPSPMYMYITLRSQYFHIYGNNLITRFVLIHLLYKLHLYSNLQLETPACTCTSTKQTVKCHQILGIDFANVLVSQYNVGVPLLSKTHSL